MIDKKATQGSCKLDGGRSLIRSLKEYLRGMVGGLMFSLPLLYTMEVWWAGFTLHPFRIFIYVLVTFTLLLGYNRYAGLRQDASSLEVVIDSVEELGLGLLVAAAFLWLLGRITFDMTTEEIAGKIIVEAMTVAIGVSVGTAQLGSNSNEEEECDTGIDRDIGQSRSLTPGESHTNFWGQMTIACCGAVLFAANIAPTEEIITIAVEITSERLLGLSLLSILLGALILFYSDFIDAKRFTRHEGIYTIVSGTVMTYAIALVASATILWIFGRFDGLALITCLAQTVVLGMPATLGASAGRLLLQ
ncbi:MAG TPA: TIGR02587 family membrane protein [Leptolyngbyaceae cyanobacterium]